MKNSNTIKKIGYALMIIASIMTLLRIMDILPRDYYTTHDLRNYIFLAGALLVVIPQFYIKFKQKRATVIVLTLFSSATIFAQDYSKQIDAFAKSFADKTTEAIQPYMSSKLQFGQIPIANTVPIMGNIVKNLPKLNSISIIESEQGKAKVAYDFVGFKNESFIHFDDKGKMTKIQLVEDLINQEAEARRQQQNSVQLPTPGELGKKHISIKVEFLAPDGLTVSGNLYEVDKNKPIILLMHQAGYNRMEYADIAPKLNEMGYNCLAVDLRSGGPFAGKPNNTNTRATEKGLKPEMIDAQQDIAAAIDFLYKKYNQNVIVWGSSFSSSLALLEGVNNSKVKGIISFSPGDYFSDAAPSLATVFSKIDKPYLVTSSKAEAETLKALINDSKLKENQSQFIPTSNGFHGSRALWEGQEGAEDYWNAVTDFLFKIE
ncbi:dienelactone hydrolase family protein [Winogradskyella immobilis]|uniref:Dienelactone hydrolase family protein n=1 Tax=Winogradskyella immobilis TaxID=2816852 RepID=A0ABS8ELG4_9FLAO|nr:dienelactone hydrolase family protein [Winogradskyella immobilis]MCC1484059.1 dienelactone hydrolase family protein [Winogradskyella immobilis]MCG0016151.1 dienelactone hydrolase family protein [Winogradskyella immobilis]